MEKFEMRQFRKSDAEAVYRLHIAGLEQTSSLIGGDARKILDKDLEDIEGVYIKNKGEFLVVTENEKIVGMGGLKKTDEETAEIKRMRVEQKLQGKGIGKLILDSLIRKAGALGYKKLLLHTSEKQIPAHRLYESRGFKEYKREAVYGQQTIFYSRDLEEKV